MSRENQKSSSGHRESTGNVPPLTEAQLEFARTLGPLLARRWIEHLATGSHNEEERSRGDDAARKDPSIEK
jgi:hypothetical protein